MNNSEPIKINGSSDLLLEYVEKSVKPKISNDEYDRLSSLIHASFFENIAMSEIRLIGNILKDQPDIKEKISKMEDQIIEDYQKIYDKSIDAIKKNREE